MSDLPDRSAGELVALVARGEASCVEVVGAHLDRIDALNPRVNAIVGLRDRADVLAEAAARSRATNGSSTAPTWSRKIDDPSVQGRPATSERSFTAIGSMRAASAAAAPPLLPPMVRPRS